MDLWERYRRYLSVAPAAGLRLDVSRMEIDDDFLETWREPLSRAFDAMDALERGEIANPDEGRMVGHYWLRAPELAPSEDLTAAILATLERIRAFAADVHAGRIVTPRGERFAHVLVVGIGGSALGPELVADALGGTSDRLRAWFFDNTDPDGMDRELRRIATSGSLAETMVVVVSKSGGTKETRNGMLEAERAFRSAGLAFERHAVAVTQVGSKLDEHAIAQRWLARFPMWDWVGGRTSELSAVGLLPAALQGIDVSAMLDGARACDEATRTRDLARNPAAMLALAWMSATKGRGERDMVVLPYKDRLALFSRYLQQLVMESLGKEKDLAGRVVHQGIAVYGNKGSTDQHAYVQQLRDGVDNFFVAFLEVLEDRHGSSMEVEPDVTSGDFLHAFLHATRQALWERGRRSLTITLPRVDARSMGALIALFERAVGLYAQLVGINAYHQPGVEAGKQAAIERLALQARLLAAVRAEPGVSRSPEEWAQALDAGAEDVCSVLEHLAANGRLACTDRGERPWERAYGALPSTET